MKKNYTRLMTVLTLALAAVLNASAQNPWKSHKADTPASEEMTPMAGTSGKIYLGHCKYSDYIYEYDGLSLDRDARIGVGIRLPRAMFEKYIGGTITAIRCGWDDAASSATYECFVRETHFNGEDLATGKGNVKFGWNEVRLSTPITITDTESLCVGFYTNVKKGVCSIPKFYPNGIANSCFLFHGETDENGEEVWYDSNSMGIMPIMLVITDSEGRFNNLVDITSLRYDEIVQTNKENVGLFVINNTGSNNISSLEVTTTQGEQTFSSNIKLSSSIAAGTSSKVKLPIYCFGTGQANISFTKVNGETPASAAQKSIHFIGIPEATAQQYVHKPLIEFYASENLYHIPTYFDDYFMMGYEPYKDLINVVCQHTDDKFMIGDPDEAIHMLLAHVKNDSMNVFVPDMTINRTAYASAPINIEGTPMHMGILYPTPSQEQYYDDVIEHPTFASVNVEANLNEAGDEVSIVVSGNVAEGVLPDGEQLSLTVYLMENEVESYDQRFWDDKEASESTNRYVHYNVIRENLTPMWGKPIGMVAGNYSMTFKTDVYSDYNPEKLSVIAFLNRGEQNGNLERQIINSTESPVKSFATGIESVEANSINANSRWFDLSGRRVLMPQKGGIYILNGKKVVLK